MDLKISADTSRGVGNAHTNFGPNPQAGFGNSACIANIQTEFDKYILVGWLFIFEHA